MKKMKSNHFSRIGIGFKSLSAGRYRPAKTIVVVAPTVNGSDATGTVIFKRKAHYPNPRSTNLLT